MPQKCRLAHRPHGFGATATYLPKFASGTYSCLIYCPLYRAIHYEYVHTLYNMLVKRIIVRSFV